MNLDKYVMEVRDVGFIKSFTDTPCGRGHVVFTPEREQALEFDTNVDAFKFWQQQSKTVLLRPDGKPNRPLTAFTLEIHK